MTTSSETPLGVPLDQDLLIEASAGTGKTYALTTLAARLIVEKDQRIERLLIVTFTVAATGELRSRIWRTLREALDEVRTPAGPTRAASGQARELVQRWRSAGTHEGVMEARLKRALRDFDRATITTIHGFCQRALRDFALLARTPFEFAVSGDDMHEVGGAVRDFWRRRMAKEPIPLLAFAKKEQFVLVPNGPSDEDAITWTMVNHAIPKALRGDPDNPESQQNGQQTGCADAPAEPISREEAFRAARAAWRQGANRSAFEDLKKKDGWLSRGQDHAALDAVEAAMERNDPELLAPHQAAFFSRDSLTKKRRKRHPPPDSELWDRLEDVAKAGRVWLAQKRRDLLRDARRSLELSAWTDRSLSFNALLVEFHRVLLAEGGSALAAGVRDRFPVTLIDEFQDTDRLQARIFRTIYDKAEDSGSDDSAGGSLFIVGDPKQSIYRFRGADVFAYIEARKRTSAREPLQLTENYRSTRGLIDAVNSLFRRRDPFLLAEIPFDLASAPAGHDPGRLVVNDPKGNGAPLQFRHFPGNAQGKPWTKPKIQNAAARQAASEIARLLELARNDEAHIERKGQERKVLEAGDIAVLVRTGEQGRKVAEALRKFGARSVELGTDSVFESAEARSLHRLLDALCADESEFDAAARLRGALADELFGLDMAELEKLRDDDAFWETWSLRAREWAECWREKGVATFVRQVLFTRVADDEPAFASNLLKYPNGQRRLTNFLHLTDLLHEAETRERLSPRRLLDWFVRSMIDVTKGETAQLRLESDENLVKVVTVHRAKGLEFPVVFCPFAWHGRGPGRPAKTASYYDPGSREPVLDLRPSKEALNRQKAEEYADELRLLYVALTRAHYRCIVTWAHARDANWSAFAWLLGAASGDAASSGTERRGGDDVLVPNAVASEGTVRDADPWAAVEANAKVVRGLHGEGAGAALSALARRASGHTHVQSVSRAPAFPDESTADTEGQPPVSPPEGANARKAATGPARKLERRLQSIRQRTSYSALATDSGAAHSQIEHEQVDGPDHDPDEPPADTVDGNTDIDGNTNDRIEGDNADAEPTPAAIEPDVFALPRGSRTGRWLHDIFERTVHQASRRATPGPGKPAGQPASGAEDADLNLICADIFRRYHVPEKWLDVTRRIVAHTLDARLEPSVSSAETFRIRDLDRPVTEMEFHLPVHGLKRAELRQGLLDHGYPTSLPATDAEIQGFLHGYIDLVARQGDRWYVIDYKSNWLGPQEAAYAGERLNEAMRHHGYHLQYLLYLAALDRHLRLRLPDYDYDRHIGGAFYLFVRGIRPGLPGNGVFRDRPSRAAIEAINSCLGEESA